jgi:tetratricopeptide (TPR) repeat protein
MRLLQQKDYQKAAQRFEAVIANHANEGALCDRARVYLRVTRGEHAKRKPFRTTRNPAECYDVGVYLLNDGDFKEALRHLQRAVEHAPTDDAAYLALAAAQLHVGETDASLQSLARAFELNARSKVIARNMSDFDGLAGNPQFDALFVKQAS